MSLATFTILDLSEKIGNLPGELEFTKNGPKDRSKKCD